MEGRKQLDVEIPLVSSDPPLLSLPSNHNKLSGDFSRCQLSLRLYSSSKSSRRQVSSKLFLEHLQSYLSSTARSLPFLPSSSSPCTSPLELKKRIKLLVDLLVSVLNSSKKVEPLASLSKRRSTRAQRELLLPPSCPVLSLSRRAFTDLSSLLRSWLKQSPVLEMSFRLALGDLRCKADWPTSSLLDVPTSPSFLDRLLHPTGTSRVNGYYHIAQLRRQSFMLKLAGEGEGVEEERSFSRESSFSLSFFSTESTRAVVKERSS